MKEFIKKFSKNIWYFILINAFLFIGHIVALFGVAFNDTGVQYANIIEALPTILICITPFLIGTIIFIFIFRKKKDFSIYHFLFLQTIIILGWIIFYIINYVPSPKINNPSIAQSNSIRKQNKINKEALEELNTDYLLIDSFGNDDKKVTFYFNEDIKKLIIELEINNEKNYETIDMVKKKIQAVEKISKYNSDYYFTFDQYDDLSICNTEECYANHLISRNGLDYTKSASIYNSNENKYYNPIKIYKNMVKNSIYNGENIYYLNENKMLNIELIDNGIKVSEDYISYIKNKRDYTWVILKDNEIILQRVFSEYELIFERDLTEKFFYDEIGNYEAYLKLGYKISNSVFWTNEQE